MKKILALLIAVFVVFSLSGCKNNEEQETQSSYSECESASYTATDIQQLIEDWQSDQEHKKTDRGLYTPNNSSAEITTLTVPVLQTAELELRLVHVYENNTLFFYGRPNSTNNILYILISKTVPYENVITSECIIHTENIAFDSGIHSWYINNNGKAISINPLDDFVIKNVNELNDYFTFETYTAGGGNGNEHVAT